MSTPLKKMSQFVNVLATGIATLSLDELRGSSVHGVLLQLGGTSFTRAHIDAITLTIGGKAIIPGISGADMQDINDYEGLSNDAGFLMLWFGDPTLEGMRGEHVGDLDLDYYDQASAVLEVSIAGATAPTLAAYAILAPAKSRMGFQYSDLEVATVRSFVRTIVTPAAAVTKQSYPISLGSQAGARVRKIAMFNANLTSAEFKKNGVPIHDDIPNAVNSFVQEEFARVPQSGLYMLDHVVDGHLPKADSTVDSTGRAFPMQVNITTSAADTLRVYADIHTPLQLL